MPIRIHIYTESTNDFQNSLVESSASSHDTRYSLLESRMEKVTAHEIIDTSVATGESLRILHI